MGALINKFKRDEQIVARREETKRKRALYAWYDDETTKRQFFISEAAKIGEEFHFGPSPIYDVETERRKRIKEAGQASQRRIEQWEEDQVKKRAGYIVADKRASDKAYYLERMRIKAEQDRIEAELKKARIIVYDEESSELDDEMDNIIRIQKELEQSTFRLRKQQAALDKMQEIVEAPSPPSAPILQPYSMLYEHAFFAPQQEKDVFVLASSKTPSPIILQQSKISSPSTTAISTAVPAHSQEESPPPAYFSLFAPKSPRCVGCDERR